MTQYTIPIQKQSTLATDSVRFKMKRKTRLYLMDGTYVDTPLNMAQIEYFIQSVGRPNSATPFLRTVGIDKSGKMRSTLISYGFLARVEDLEFYA